MAPDRTILHLFKKINPRPPPSLKNYGVHTIKPQLRPCIRKIPLLIEMIAECHNLKKDNNKSCIAIHQ